MSYKTLTLDIESTPNLGYIWELYNQNVAPSSVVAPREMISYAAKWHGERKTEFYSTFHDGKPAMLKALWNQMDEADAIVTYNGNAFDFKVINGEFIQHIPDFGRPSQYRSIDLYRVVKKHFKLFNHKLDSVLKTLGMKGKVETGGMGLWIACMNGDSKAWAKMRRYNKGDVVKTEQLFERLKPWIDNLPNPVLYEDEVSDVPQCPECGGVDWQRRGFYYTAQSQYQQYRCNRDGRWFRDTKAVYRVSVR